MNNKQRWMGGVVLLGGGVLLAALLLKGQDEIKQDRQQKPAQVAEVETKDAVNHSLGSLTVDVETEKRLLEQQRRDREKSVAEQEARAAEFLAMQQQAEADAARKAAEEYAALNAHRMGQQSSDNIPPELVEDEQAKQKRLAEEKAAQDKKLALQKLEQQKANSSTEAAKKEAERKAAESKAVEEKRKLEQQQKAEAERKAAEAKRKAEEERKATEKKEAERKAAEEKRKADEKRKAEEAKKKAEAEQARKLLEGEEDKQWMVQVALAANEANADAVAAKLRAKGYKVTKSPTSKGIRIMVGPSKDRDTADALRKKITSDASLNMKSAWVNDWVPLDKR
ncbi:SPOR domain-containing protein [Acinetobacter pseudolwoffii]|uniref:SPOR domain-containing protein n=1 Tax=Acinetobacter pseudolwoffii TaxID=2053287 RepID=UPI000C24DEAA|nr:SPOR domain-containing protein [Acinetobacter pseudolwoffii]PJI28890.1 cell division protein [Acinetobacter pseudolwoffii]